MITGVPLNTSTMNVHHLYDLFDRVADQLGYEPEPFSMYRPTAVNVESYLRFAMTSDEPFQTHTEAMTYYLTRISTTRRASPPPAAILTNF